MGEAVRRIVEGAAMMRTKGEAGTGNVVSAVQHARLLNAEMAHISREPSSIEAVSEAIMQPFHRIEKNSFMHELTLENTPFGTFDEVKAEVNHVLELIARDQRLPVVTFSAGGIATPADAALMMRHGMDGIFVGSGIFKSSDPKRTAEAIVLAAHHHSDSAKVAEACQMIGEAMPGLEIDTLDVHMEKRGW